VASYPRARRSLSLTVLLAGAADYDATRCDVYCQGKLSPDSYAWIFPHGDTVSIGVGSANKGFRCARR